MIEETDELVEAVARALCFANLDKPDDLVYPAKILPLTHGGYTIMSASMPLVPNWQLYQDPARYAIRAIGKILKG